MFVFRRRADTVGLLGSPFVPRGTLAHSRACSPKQRAGHRLAARWQGDR